ncbi:hypothetical protein KAH81_01835 [bacterium]|nr:hypothetical protein [bacterium]
MFKNNAFTLDRMNILMERMNQLSNGLDKYGTELAYTPEEIDEIKSICDSLHDYANDQNKEDADVAGLYAGLHDEEGKMLKALYDCRKFVRGEVDFGDETTGKYLEERFRLDEMVPKRRVERVKMAEDIIEAFDNLPAELPGLVFADVPFERLRAKLAATNGYWDQVQKERAELKAATASLRRKRTECVKTLRRVYLRATSFWGINDFRLLELGMVHKSGIWTYKKKPENSD